MSAFEILQRGELLDWSTLRFGRTKGWVTDAEAIGYAVQRLQENQENPEHEVLLAGLASPNADEVDTLVAALAPVIDTDAARRRWAIGLIEEALAANGRYTQQAERLQAIYAGLDYPEELALLSPYAQDFPPGEGPVESATRILAELRAAERR